MELFVPISFGFCERRLQEDLSVLRLQVEDHTVLNQFAAVHIELCKLINPSLEQLLKTSDQNLLDVLIESVDPESQVGKFFKVKITDELLDHCEALLKFFLNDGTLFHLSHQLLNLVRFLHYAVNFLLEGDDFDKDLVGITL